MSRWRRIPSVRPGIVADMNMISVWVLILAALAVAGTALWLVIGQLTRRKD